MTLCESPITDKVPYPVVVKPHVVTVPVHHTPVHTEEHQHGLSGGYGGSSGSGGYGGSSGGGYGGSSGGGGYGGSSSYGHGWQ